MTALVFNCHYNGLSIIQELGRRGVDVLALDCVRSVGTYSRYAHYYQCPDPQVAESEFIKFLMQLGPQFRQKPVLFPTNDHWAVAVSRHKEILSQYYFPCVADYSAVQLVIEKQRFHDWALANGYPAPRSWQSDVAREIPDESFPLAAKPEYRRIASNDRETGDRSRVFDQMRLTVLKNREELKAFEQRHRNLLPYFLFQEYVPGLSDSMFTVGIYADRQHKVKGMFTGRKVRGFPPDIGDCIVGQVEEMPGEIKELVKSMCKEIGYHGIAEFEFKRDTISGQYKIIEINPRSWSWIGITPACGVSLPWIAYADLTSIENVSYVESAVPMGSVKYVKILEDMKNCLYGYRRLGFHGWNMTPLQWWKSLRAKKIVCAEFAKDDVLIGIRASYYFLKSIAAALIRRGSA